MSDRFQPISMEAPAMKPLVQGVSLRGDRGARVRTPPITVWNRAGTARGTGLLFFDGLLLTTFVNDRGEKL